MDDALMACRALHFAASLIAFGVLLFQTALAPGALAAALAPALRRIVIACVVLASVTSILWFAATAASMGDGWGSATSPTMLMTVLADTQFGRVWLWHMLLSFGLLAGVWRSGAAGTPRTPVMLVVSMLQLGTLGLVGHAVMRSGLPGLANRASMILHLVAAGFWLGSLIPVIRCLRIAADHPLRGAAIAALTRFSNVGHASVVLVVATGLVNADLIEGGLSLNLATPYQQLLAVKVLIVTAMILLAIVNRYWLVPRLKHDAAALDRIRRICVVVFYLGLGAVALVSVFGMLPPTLD